MKNYGDPDGFGGETKGVSLAVAPGATVASPADSWVAFAGPYRSYGQLLILNAGEGYYMVLAGMERIQVSVGQFVLAGEPVAVMGSGRRAAPAGIGSYWRRRTCSLYRIAKERQRHRPPAVVGEIEPRKGARMIRKVSYLALGAALGASATFLAPGALQAVAPKAYATAAETYRQLNLFGDVFEKSATITSRSPTRRS